jgi:myo-inositol-1(or 4)-monophosphatase
MSVKLNPNPQHHDLKLDSLCHEVVQLAKAARSEIVMPLLAAKNFKLKDKTGEGRNFVTEVDLKTEAFLLEGLRNLLPHAGIIAEESTRVDAGNAFEWVVDPIDGTTNLMHGLPPYCISIALLEEKLPVIGVVLELFSNECFTAWHGGGAYLNGKPIHASHCKNLQDALLCTGFPYDFSNEVYFDAWISLYATLAKKAHGVRRLGAAAVDLAYVACGRLDGYYEYNLEPWDMAAGVLLVKEAGGMVSDFNSDLANPIFTGKIIAAAPGIHSALLDHVQKFMQS